MNQRRNYSRQRLRELREALDRLEQLQRLDLDTSAIEMRITQIEQDPDGTAQPDYETWD